MGIVYFLITTDKTPPRPLQDCGRWIPEWGIGNATTLVCAPTVELIQIHLEVLHKMTLRT